MSSSLLTTAHDRRELPAPAEHAAAKHFPNLFSLLLILLLAANYFAPFADLDFSWQIRTGEQIVRTGRLRPVESFSYTIPGQEVPEFEWLYELTLWAVWTPFGFGGLKLLKTILVGTPLLLLGLRLRREGVRWPGILSAILVAVFVLSAAWNLRPLYCTTIGLLLVSGWLHDHCAGRRPLSVWLPIVFLLWGNLHPGVITGQGLLLGTLVWEWLNRWLKWNRPLSRPACLRLTVVGGLGLAASFVGPDPLQRLLYPFRPELAQPIQRVFVEMQPLWAFWGRAPFATALVYAVAILVAVTVLLRFRSYRLWEIALLVGLAGLANLAVRSLQDWLVIMLALGVPHLAVLLRHLRRQRRAWRRRAVEWESGSATLVRPLLGKLLVVERSCQNVLNSPWLRWQGAWPAAALGLLAAVSLFPPMSRQMPIRDARDWPAAALNWIEAHGLRGRFFGPPDYGSYVTWRLGEAARCYVDTRGFFFPPQLLEDSHYLPQLGPDWPARLDRVLAYGTDYFLLETTGPRGQLWRSLQPYIDQPLYCDAQAVLLDAGQVRRAVAQLRGKAPSLATSHAGRATPADSGRE